MDYTTTVGNRTVEWLAPNSDQWNTVWVSPEFQQLMERPSWLRDHVFPYVSRRPLGWFTPPVGSRFYFSSWLMNSVMRRAYDNPLIQDLYVLHEALHAASLDDYFAHATSPADALRANEIQVSLETECWVYLREPQWIGKTFPNLWVTQPHIQQRLRCAAHNSAIKTAQEQALWGLSQRAPWPISTSEVSSKDLWWVRRRMNQFAVSPADHTVARYERMADRWIAKIQDRIDVVQHGRFQFNKDLETQDWRTAVDGWTTYLNRHLHQGLPFADLQLTAPTQEEKA